MLMEPRQKKFPSGNHSVVTPTHHQNGLVDGPKNGVFGIFECMRTAKHTVDMASRADLRVKWSVSGGYPGRRLPTAVAHATRHKSVAKEGRDHIFHCVFTWGTSRKAPSVTHCLRVNWALSVDATHGLLPRVRAETTY